MPDQALIVGRGLSAHRFDFSTWSGPIMAVSSGVFALPETVMPRHVVTMDEPKFFLDELSKHVSFSWQNDPYARVWPFWREPDVWKETLIGRVKPGQCRHFPGEAIDHLPPDYREPFIRALAGKLHEYGYQPGWADYPSVRGWPLDKRLPVNFSKDGLIGLEGIANSLLMAVQVAYRLDYRRLYFIGVDLEVPHVFSPIARKLREWYPAARAAGMEWVNLSRTSKLQEFLHSADHQDDTELRLPGSEYDPGGRQSNGVVPRERRVCDLSGFAGVLPSSEQAEVGAREEESGRVATYVPRRVRR